MEHPFLSDQLDAGQCAEELVKLSSEYASLVTSLAQAEVLFKKELYQFMKDNPELPANKVKIRAEGGELYGKLRMLQAKEKGTLEMIRSLKKFVRIKEQEWETSKNL